MLDNKNLHSSIKEEISSCILSKNCHFKIYRVTSFHGDFESVKAERSVFVFDSSQLSNPCLDFKPLAWIFPGLSQTTPSLSKEEFFRKKLHFFVRTVPGLNCHKLLLFSQIWGLKLLILYIYMLEFIQQELNRRFSI